MNQKDVENLKPRSLYLAHPFDSRYEIRDWELGFEERTKINLINPFFDLEVEVFEKRDVSGASYYAKTDFKGLVKKEIREIYKSDGLIGIVDGKKSYGTLQEMVYACFYLKLVYLVVSNGDHQHPWLVYNSTKIFKNLDNLEEHFNELHN